MITSSKYFKKDSEKMNNEKQREKGDNKNMKELKLLKLLWRLKCMWNY